MSSRVLRKLQGDKDKELLDEVSDTETDTPVSGGARRKQLNINRYDLVGIFAHLELLQLRLIFLLTVKPTVTFRERGERR